MSIMAPKETVYYYECSYGKYRLTYYIPPNELERLHKEKSISELAVQDFPDGVDLRCTEEEFAEFERSYGYRPPIEPAAVRRAFLAIFSTTQNWKKFHGSGFIAASDLEAHIGKVERALKRKKLIETKAPPPPKRPSLTKHHRHMHRLAIQRKKLHESLEEMRIKGIDPRRTMAQQRFSDIKMGKGVEAEDVFIRLHQKSIRRRR